MATLAQVRQLRIDLSRHGGGLLGCIWRHHLYGRLPHVAQICAADDVAVPAHWLPVCLFHGTGKTIESALAVDVGHVAFLDVVFTACLRVEGHLGRPGRSQPDPDVDRVDPRTSSIAVHQRLHAGWHDVCVLPIHDLAAVRHAGEDGLAFAGSRSRLRCQPVEGVLACHGAFEQGRHHLGLYAGLYSRCGRVCDSVAVGWGRERVDRPRGVG